VTTNLIEVAGAGVLRRERGLFSADEAIFSSMRAAFNKSPA
jgi:hypothetical protein